MERWAMVGTAIATVRSLRTKRLGSRMHIETVCKSVQAASLSESNEGQHLMIERTHSSR